MPECSQPLLHGPQSCLPKIMAQSLISHTVGPGTCQDMMPRSAPAVGGGASSRLLRLHPRCPAGFRDATEGCVAPIEFVGMNPGSFQGGDRAGALLPWLRTWVSGSSLDHSLPSSSRGTCLSTKEDLAASTVVAGRAASSFLVTYGHTSRT